MNSNQEPYMFLLGSLIDQKYEVIKHLGKGGYGEIYVAKIKKDGKLVAIKVERSNRVGNLELERHILTVLRDSGAKHVPILLASGCHEGQIYYIVMNLLGENLSNVRRSQVLNKFSQRTTCMLAMQMLKAIKELHDYGYLHRDIKPGNFVTTNHNSKYKVYLIDFGLSRRHLKPDGTVRTERPKVRWVGSRRYMSPNTHNRMDQGRRDDLWSFLYVVIEFFTGSLPWGHLKGINSLDMVIEAKSRFTNEMLTKYLPEEYKNVLRHIMTLKYADRPNYRYIHMQFYNLFLKEGGHKSMSSQNCESQSLSFSSSLQDLEFSSVHSGPLSDEHSMVNQNRGKSNKKTLKRLWHLNDSESDDYSLRATRLRMEMELNRATKLKREIDPNELNRDEIYKKQFKRTELENSDIELNKKKKSHCVII